MGRRGEQGGDGRSKELHRQSSFLRHNVAVISIQNSERRIPLTRCVSKVTVNSPLPLAYPPSFPDTVTLTQASEGNSQENPVRQVKKHCLDRELDSVKSAIVRIVQEKQGYLEENGALKEYRKAHDDLKQDMKLLIIENSKLKYELMKAKESNNIMLNRKTQTYKYEPENSFKFPKYRSHLKTVEEFVDTDRCFEDRSPDQPRRSPDGQEAERQGGDERENEKREKNKREKEERGNTENIRLLQLQHVQVVKGLLEEILRYQSVRCRIQEECHSLQRYMEQLKTVTPCDHSPSPY